jgi:type I restriction enzyme, R subunit
MNVQFEDSPTLSTELLNAIIDADAAYTIMSKQALDSERVREGLKNVLLGPAEGSWRREGVGPAAGCS